MSSQKDYDARVQAMCQKIYSVIQSVKPDLVLLEDVSLRGNTKTLIQLSRLQGAIMMMCFIERIPFEVYAPTRWRKAIGIKQGRTKREELKEAAIDFIRQGYGIRVGDDVAEAIAMGLGHLRLTDQLPDLSNLTKTSDRRKRRYEEHF